MTQEKRLGTLRNPLTWFGAGLVAGALLWLVVVAWVYGGGAFGGGSWWMLSVLVGILALFLVVDRRDGSEKRYPFRMVPLAVVGLLVAWPTFPRDSFEVTTRDAWSFSPSPTDVHLWVATCAVGLGCSLLLLGLRRPDPRPWLHTLPSVGAGSLAVALTGTLVGTVLLPWVPRQVADELPDPAQVPANVTRVGWEWRPPMGVEVTDVLSGGHGPLVLLRDGAVALDGTDGEELWSYRRPYDPVHDVWVDEGHVHVRHQVGTDDGGDDLLQTVALDAETGEITEEDSDAVVPPGLGVWEYGHELVAEALDLPEECVVSQHVVHDRLLVGAFGCPEDPDTDTVVAVDPRSRTELWRTEWDASAEGNGPRPTETPTTWAGSPIVVADGPEGRTVALDPATGNELVTLPDGTEADDFHGVVHADPQGSVVAFDTDRLEYTLHRADASGEVTDTTVLRETFLGYTIGSERMVALDDALVIAKTNGVSEDDREVTVQVAPFGGTTGWEEGIVFREDRRIGTSSSEATLTPTPGALVFLSEDERSQVLEGFVP
ncbi:outer membrane protein assembly factor BamB family protein [Nocardiopsis listeri]|uniref:outer membrane protein assembly factor BamB family protein n=1 Tax=Nocardiopsis listeri TaxID=53440 RepID=UPI000ABAA867|nr:PQQ-binding-like beta-propeller repeat protein [Nocardiopsis listeri]